MEKIQTGHGSYEWIVVGVSTAVNAVGPFLGGWLFDVTGSYGLAFLAAAVAIAESSVAAAWLAARPVAGARGAVR